MALYHRLKRRFFSKVWLVRGLLVLLLTGVLALSFLAIRPQIPKVVSLWQALHYRLPSHSGRTNFLLLGMAGDSVHAGYDLTDTVIFVSIDQTTGDTLLLSLPRDLWVPSLRAKINTAYHYGQEKQPQTGGFLLAKSAVSELIDQPIDYVAIINFSQFEKFIDSIKGLDIQVSAGFIDHDFPIPDLEDDLCDGDPQYRCRYQTVEFKPGLQHMDGVTALKYVRSRMAEGDEGTDFARSARQEKLLLAIKDKLITPNLLSRPRQVRDLMVNFSKSITTDITPQQYPALAKLALKFFKTKLRTAAISEPLVVTPPISPLYDYQWVLIPQDNDPQVLSSFVKNLLVGPTQK